MKTRQGFVSNSSSSSFIVAIPKDVILSESVMGTGLPKDVKKRMIVEPKSLRDVMFGAKDSVQPYDWNEAFSAEQIVERVIQDMIQQTPNNIPAIMEELTDDMGEQEARDFIDSHKDSNIYVFTYGDENGAFDSTMEHGEIFEKLPHRRISHH